MLGVATAHDADGFIEPVNDGAAAMLANDCFIGIFTHRGLSLPDLFVMGTSKNSFPLQTAAIKPYCVDEAKPLLDLAPPSLRRFYPASLI